MIVVKDIKKTYRMGDQSIDALRGVSLSVSDGEFISLMGPSGSGKSTLMSIIGCLDRPTSGSYKLFNKEVSDLSDDELARIRNEKIGFIFQSFNLLPRFSAIKNVELPLIYSGLPSEEWRKRSLDAMKAVGLENRIDHKPTELSGGQQQRVAIARALVNNPGIILADEPTGNLDSKSGEQIMAILQRLNEDKGVTIILVTHEPNIASFSKRIIHIKDGAIVKDEKNARRNFLSALKV